MQAPLFGVRNCTSGANPVKTCHDALHTLSPVLPARPHAGMLPASIASCGVGHRTMLTIELTEVILVPQATLWSVVADVLHQSKFVAYQISKAWQTNAADPGCEFKWNEMGVLLGKRYECECRIFAWEPPAWLSFGTKDLFHISYELDPVPGGTKLAYRCDLPQTPPSRAGAFTELCQQSLHNLKYMLERPARPSRT